MSKTALDYRFLAIREPLRELDLGGSFGPHVLKSFRVWTEETGSVTTA